MRWCLSVLVALVSLLAATSAFADVGSIATTRQQSRSCASNADCARNEYCDKNDGDCTGTGACQVRPEACQYYRDPVCGCDGKPYPSRCEAHEAGVSIRSKPGCGGLPPTPALNLMGSALDAVGTALDACLEGGRSTSPIAQGHAEVVAPIVLSMREKGVRTTLWLHHRLKRTCWYFKGLYEYEAFVTTGQDPASPRYAVDSIMLHIARSTDNASYNHGCPSTDYCAKSDEVYNTSGACGRTCLSATATIGGVSWSTNASCID